MKQSGTAGITGWRLPAPELERRVAEAVRGRLSDPSWLNMAVPTRSGDEIGRHHAALKILCAGEDIGDTLGLIKRIDLAPAALQIAVDAVRLAGVLGTDPAAMEMTALTLHTPFQLRKRGLETRLILGNETGAKDSS